MKKYLFALALVSLSAQAEVAEYSGSNNGQPCQLSVQLKPVEVSLNDCRSDYGTNSEIKIIKGKAFVKYAGLDSEGDCSITISYDKNNTPTKAVMKVAPFIFSPPILHKMTCNDLVRVK